MLNRYIKTKQISVTDSYNNLFKLKNFIFKDQHNYIYINNKLIICHSRGLNDESSIPIYFGIRIEKFKLHNNE